MTGLVVHLDYQLPRRGLPTETEVTTWVAAALKVAKRRRATEVSIVVMDREPARAMNRDYRGRDYATNVLSFPVDLPPAVRSPLIGDLVLCAPVLIEEAAAQGKSLKAHCAHLCIHGVLHLLGFDHEEETAAEVMESLEIKALATLSIADPYQ